MPEENTETSVQRHLSDKQTWLRLLYMILFGLVFEIVKFAVFLVAVVQFLFKLFSGEVQPQITKLGASLADYLRQIVEFLAFRSDEKPYPWGRWPMPEPTAAEAPVAEKAPAAKTTVRRGSRSKRPAKGKAEAEGEAGGTPE